MPEIPTDWKTCLGIDFGLSRIGLATGQRITRTASPIGTIKAKSGEPDWIRLKKIIEEWSPHLIVVGMPLDVGGTENYMCLKVQAFIEKLQQHVAIPIITIDEHLSSVEAEALDTRKKKPVDEMAAMVILESWLRTSKN